MRPARTTNRRQAGMLIIVLALSGCWGDEWTGFAYPNKNDLSKHIEVGTFSSLEQCRDAASAAIDPARGDYECGLDCKPGTLPRVCEKTSR